MTKTQRISFGVNPYESMKNVDRGMVLWGNEITIAIPQGATHLTIKTYSPIDEALLQKEKDIEGEQ